MALWEAGRDCCSLDELPPSPPSDFRALLIPLWGRGGVSALPSDRLLRPMTGPAEGVAGAGSHTCATANSSLVVIALLSRHRSEQVPRASSVPL